MWESLIYLGTLLLILTFPTGRLDGIAARLVVVGGAVNAALNVALIAMLPQTGAGGAISGCQGACPENGMALVPDPERALDLIKPFQIAVIAVALGTAGCLLWRLATGTPPRRRALAIGTPIALLFTAVQVAYLALSLLEVDAPDVQRTLQWTFTAARAALWYGFLAALVAAQLFAARALARLVRRSVQRPSRAELEAMLRGPLGDPGLRLRFWDAGAGGWDGRSDPRAHEAVTVVERDGRPAALLIHDRQLDDDPELLHTAGSVVLLAAENAELDTGWSQALDELRRSRARITQAIDDERRTVARNLHDGVQQRLHAVAVRLALTAETAAEPEVRGRLAEIGDAIEDTIDEVRDVSHGLYPNVLSDHGLVAALQAAVAPLALESDGIGRHSPQVEAAIYYCCLEAIQNATKHGGPAVSVRVSLHEDAGDLSFRVADDGHGFEPSGPHAGMGLQSMRDRLAAVGGRLSIASSPGQGTVVSGAVPLGRDGAPAGG
jgi:signal transduction histidine kinase